MQDIVITLVFMMIFLAFFIWPAIKIVDFIDVKFNVQPKLQNFLTLFFTILIAFSAAVFMKVA